MRKTLFWIGFVASLGIAEAQEKAKSVLSLEDYYAMVLNYHPIARQAAIFTEKGYFAVQEARGGFDPKLVSEYDRKDFKNLDYFDIWDTYLKIPTLLNVDLKAGYERNSGIFLNPERNVPSDGLFRAGVAVPLGRGLINNSRRIALKKGQFQERNFQNEGNRVLNNLLFDANHVYWTWYENEQKLSLVENNLQLIIQRFNGIREGVLRGENAAIDSVETLIQVQQWENNLVEAKLNVANTLLTVQNFVWSDSLQVPYYKPEYQGGVLDRRSEDFINQALASHPDLNKLTIKGSILELDRKQSAEQLKPILDVEYNFFAQKQEESQESFFSSNYKVGVQFEYPLLLRKERAKLQTVKLKQQENNLQIRQKNREVVNKISQSYNKVLAINELISQQERILINYERMLEAEQIKFENGESSIFLLNTRENKKLQSEVKLIELKAKQGKSIGELKWAAGQLHQEALN